MPDMALCSWKVCANYSNSKKNVMDFLECLICADSVPPKQQAMLDVSTSKPCPWLWPWHDVCNVNTSSSCGWWKPIHVVVLSQQIANKKWCLRSSQQLLWSLRTGWQVVSTMIFDDSWIFDWRCDAWQIYLSRAIKNEGKWLCDGSSQWETTFTF